MTGSILVVDDDAKLLRLVEFELESEGLRVLAAGTGEEALRRMREDAPSAVVLDLELPTLSGKEVLARMRDERMAIPVVILTASSSVDEVVECMRLGAHDYLQKPFDRTRLVTSIQNARRQGDLTARVISLARELQRTSGFSAIIGSSPALKRSLSLLERAARSEVTVLLEGESGTGKEVAARAIHAESERRSRPFVAVNCGAIPEGLIETELFGHEKGAFTGAAGARPGRFEEADGGTLFLDEIGELRTDLQVRLLRVLQDKTVQRVGGGKPVSVDVRIIAATNRDLRVETRKLGFREDLYYRLAVFPVRLPALRERSGDVRLLSEEFMRRFAERHRRGLTGFTPEAARTLERYPWPGNVRELENVVERAVILEDGPAISLASLPDEIVVAGAPEMAVPAPVPGGPQERPLGPDEIRPMEDEERRILLRALEITQWNVQEAAERLGIGRATIYRKLERYGIQRQAARTPPR